MKVNQIIVLQVSSIGRTLTRRYFDKHGVMEGKDYLFFRIFSENLVFQLEPGLPQLIFTSHSVDNDGFNVAECVKAFNPQAIIIALTSTEIESVAGTKLDGYIAKFEQGSSEKPSAVAKAFLSGLSREKLIQMVKA